MGPPRHRLQVRLEIVTPIMGGAPIPRTIDDVDVVRAPSIRGHLRFWWRALHATDGQTSSDLASREAAIWGRPADEDGGRSTLDLQVEVEAVGEPMTGDPLKELDKYATWPARAPQKGTEHAPRRRPGTRFVLRVDAIQDLPDEIWAQVERSVRAWVLFGGYGGRTRRGLGALALAPQAGGTVMPPGADKWLPKLVGEPRASLRAELERLLGLDQNAHPREATDVPRLQGATILTLGPPTVRSTDAWLRALDALHNFRQLAGARPPSGPSSFARDPGHGGKPGARSNWPEPDKVRQLSPKPPGGWGHSPRHNAAPAWPRAGFGLPIMGHWQTDSCQEPSDYAIAWRRPGESAIRDRLSSPLIVRPLPLADGTFVACLTWLHRSYPSGGEVVLATPGLKADGLRTALSAAPFDVMVGAEDLAQFSPIATPRVRQARAGDRLRVAFVDWCISQKRAVQVYP